MPPVAVALSCEDSPLQIVSGEALAVTVGCVPTTTVVEALALHPSLETVQVYAVVTVGDTTGF